MAYSTCWLYVSVAHKTVWPPSTFEMSIYTINTRDEFRNVSVTDADAALSRDAYAMSHLSAVNLACTHRLAGRVDARAAAATVQPCLRDGSVVPV